MKEQTEIDLVDLLKSVLRHIVMVALIPVIAVAVTAYLCWNVIPKTYTAEVTMYVLNQTSSDSISSNDVNLSAQLVSDYQQIAQSRRVTDAACETLGLKNADDYDITVSSKSSTRFITLSVKGREPKTAADLANALAEQLASCIAEVTNVENISVIDEAIVPRTASGPLTMRNCVIAAIAGFAFASLLAILIDMINRKVRTKDDVEKYFGLPVLAQIPTDKGK